MKKIILLINVFCILSIYADAQIYRVAEMNTGQIKNLDKSKTVVILPGGILEEHGPYLPSFTDGYWNEKVTAELAKAITVKKGWLGEQNFKWIFVVHGHGAPNHVRAIDQAGDFFRDTYRGRMVNLTGLLPVVSAWDGKKSDAERQEDGLPIHAGMDETSMMLALRPDLVSSKYKTAKPFSANKMENLINIARSEDWLGYFGSPRLSKKEQYANGWQIALNEAVNYGLKILDGLDERTIPRFGDEMMKSPPDVLLDKASLEHETEIREKQEKWLKEKKLRK